MERAEHTARFWLCRRRRLAARLVDTLEPADGQSGHQHLRCRRQRYLLRARARVRSTRRPREPADQRDRARGRLQRAADSTATEPRRSGERNVTITWTAPPFTSASHYILEAGSSVGSTNIGTFTVPVAHTSIGGAVPTGTSFVRLRASNACGESAASSDVFFIVGSATTIPDPPTTWTYVFASGFAVTVQWTPSPSASGYLLEAGSTPGQSDLGTFALPVASFAAAGVPSGVYFVRVRAFNAAGLSPRPVRSLSS